MTTILQQRFLAIFQPRALGAVGPPAHLHDRPEIIRGVEEVRRRRPLADRARRLDRLLLPPERVLHLAPQPSPARTGRSPTTTR